MTRVDITVIELREAMAADFCENDGYEGHARQDFPECEQTDFYS